VLLSAWVARFGRWRLQCRFPGAGQARGRLHIVTSKLVDSGDMKRWFVEYETGPMGEAVALPDEFE
jgi:hypothetical protein